MHSVHPPLREGEGVGFFWVFGRGQKIFDLRRTVSFEW